MVKTARKTYRTRRLTAEDLAAAAALNDAYRKKVDMKERVRKRYHDFCALNRLPLWVGDSVTLFLGSVKAQLAAGSVKNHVLQMKVLERERFLPECAVRLRSYIKIAEENCARKGVEHCDDFPSFQQAVLTVLGVEDAYLRAAAVAMLALGLRYETLVKPFEADNIKFALHRNKPRVIYDLSFSKNRRSPAAKERITLVEVHLQRVPLVLLRQLETAFATHSCPFEGLNYDDLNKALKKTCVVPGMTVTPGSLRRCFIWTEIERCTDEMGVVDWEAVRRVSGHKKVETLKSFYQRKLLP
jgi:integrase